MNELSFFKHHFKEKCRDFSQRDYIACVANLTPSSDYQTQFDSLKKEQKDNHTSNRN